MPPVMFASTSPNFRLVVDPTDYDWKANRIAGETKGHTIEFVDGIYQTSDPAEIAVLRAKAETSQWVLEVGGPVAPDATDLLLELIDADTLRVSEILTAEAEGWQRPQVLAACEKRLTAPQSEPDLSDPDAPYGYTKDGTPKKGPGGRPRVEA